MEKNSVDYNLIKRNTGHNWLLLPTYRHAIHVLFIVQERIPLLGFNFSSNSDFKSVSVIPNTLRELVKSFKPVYLVQTETFVIFPVLLACSLCPVPNAPRPASSLERSFDFPV